MEKQSNAFHIGLLVNDIEKAATFYSKFLGIAPAKQKEDYLKYEVLNPNLALTFNLAPGKVTPKFGHMGFRVTTHEELDQARERVNQGGLAFRDEKDTNCCYANQDKFWVTDPDGYEWEVYVLNNDVESNDTAQDKTCCTTEAACC